CAVRPARAAVSRSSYQHQSVTRTTRRDFLHPNEPIPMLPMPPAASQAPRTVPPLVPQASRFTFHAMERILIVEDETAMRRALEDVLAAEGYRVLSAADGEAGLQRAINEKPDLILLDIMLPKLDGF